MGVSGTQVWEFWKPHLESGPQSIHVPLSKDGTCTWFTVIQPIRGILTIGYNGIYTAGQSLRKYFEKKKYMFVPGRLF